MFAYYKIYRTIRHHQSQVQTNEKAIDIEKYKKSVFTILYILAIFLLSYVLFVCCTAVDSAVELAYRSWKAAVNACAAIAFSSSSIPCSTIGG